jgi:hypothetical protein
LNRNSIVPDLIKVSAVIVAMPRWVLALLAADGFSVPNTWVWVHGVSAVFGAMMTILEGIAIAYVLGALVKAKGRQATLLGLLTIATCATFAGVLTPSVYARVTGEEIKLVLPAGWVWFWAGCVAMSTVATVASVGYAQAVVYEDAEWRGSANRWRIEAERLNGELAQQDAQVRNLLAQAEQPSVKCPECERVFGSKQSVAAHTRHAHRGGKV